MNSPPLGRERAESRKALKEFSRASWYSCSSGGGISWLKVCTPPSSSSASRPQVRVPVGSSVMGSPSNVLSCVMNWTAMSIWHCFA